MPDITALYDRRTDVLYLTKSDDDAQCAREDSMGIVWRYAHHDHLIGATIIDYHEIWGDRLAELIATLAKSFHVSRNSAKKVLESVDG